MTPMLIISLLVGLSVATPPTFTPCEPKGPEFKTCVRGVVDYLIDNIRDGVPEWNLPQLEPIFIKELILTNDNTIKAKATNVTMRGLSYFKIEDLDIDLEQKKISLGLSFTEAELDAHVDLSAQILIPIAGQGTMHSDIEGILADAELLYGEVIRNGKTYVHVNSITLKLRIKKATPSFVLANDPGGVLASAMTSVVQTGNGEVEPELVVILEREISKTIIELVNKICSHFTKEELLPNSD